MVALLAVLATAILYSTMGLNQFSVEVCMAFQGARACRTAAGANREEALRTATDNACAFLASGRTDSMACSRTPPESTRWIKK